MPAITTGNFNQMEIGIEENMRSSTIDFAADSAAALTAADPTELWNMEKTLDQSLLWKPTPPLVSSFLEAKNVYENGTDEIRRLLIRECSLIYECNSCRNIFRSLTCFITHKRVYCTMSCNDIGSNHTNGFQSVTLNEGLKLSKEAESYDTKNFLPNTTLGEQIVNGNEIFNNVHNVQESYIKSQNIETSPQESSINLDSSDHQNTNLRDDVDFKNKHQPEEPKTDELKPGSTQKNSDSILNGLTDENKTQTSTKVCKICKAAFATEKALKIHAHKKHLSKNYAFQCPLCSQTFGQPGAVVRHLSNEHKKSIRFIKMMRDAIYKRKILSHENKTENDTNTETAIPCPYCGRTFQRKAVLSTHLASCQMKVLDSDEEQGNIAADTKDINKRQSPKAQDVGRAKTNVPLNSVTTITQNNHELENDTNISTIIDTNSSSISRCSKPLENTLNKPTNKQKIKAKFMPCLCKICHKHFNALCNLRRHISMFHYRTRKFGCKLCDYRAYRKYDVINHLGYMHKIMGEKETISLEYMETFEEENSREDVDDDVLLITDEKTDKPNKIDPRHKINSELESKKDENYQNKYTKSMVISTRLQKSTRERKNLKRLSIPQQQYSKNESSQSHYQKRPRRNCIKAVNKDFVYDLSTILKKDNAEDGEWKIDARGTVKRRNTMTINDDIYFEAKDQSHLYYKPLINTTAECIKGAAEKKAVSLVHQGRAAYATVPQLPTERPQVRVRHTSIYKADISTIPIFETTALEEARLKAKLLDDSFLENLSSTNEFKIKPRLALPQSTINSLLKKVDLTLQKQLQIKNIDLESKNCTTHHDLMYDDLNSSSEEVLFKPEHHESFTHCENDSINIPDDGKAYSKLVCLPQKPRKCIKLMECLLENKTQNRESLLRFALEN